MLPGFENEHVPTPVPVKTSDLRPAGCLERIDECPPLNHILVIVAVLLVVLFLDQIKRFLGFVEKEDDIPRSHFY